MELLRHMNCIFILTILSFIFCQGWNRDQRCSNDSGTDERQEENRWQNNYQTHRQIHTTTGRNKSKYDVINTLLNITQ